MSNVHRFLKISSLQENNDGEEDSTGATIIINISVYNFLKNLIFA